MSSTTPTIPGETRKTAPYTIPYTSSIAVSTRQATFVPSSCLPISSQVETKGSMSTNTMNPYGVDPSGCVIQAPGVGATKSKPQENKALVPPEWQEHKEDLMNNTERMTVEATEEPLAHAMLHSARRYGGRSL